MNHKTSTLEKINEIVEELDPILKEGENKKFSSEKISNLLAILLFSITRSTGQKLIEIRDYRQIEREGPFRYAGQVETLYEEDLFPHDLYTFFKKLGLDRHVGPSYLRVKGLLTHQKIRHFFAKQLSFRIYEYVKKTPLKKDGVILFLPNMTGGAWIGDETKRVCEETYGDNICGYKIWPCTPYARKTRKPIEVLEKKPRLVDFVEGLVPEPEETALILNFEELRTSAETTKNAVKGLRYFGYDEENKVRVAGVCVFEYNHPVCKERLERLGVDSLYLVDGRTFFRVSYEKGFISQFQYKTVIDWLNDPWEFTRKILPVLKKRKELEKRP